MIAKTNESKPVKSQKRSYLAYAANHAAIIARDQNTETWNII
jgi:hypothetical protein